MIYRIGTTITVPRYTWTTTNQHGQRYRRAGSTRVPVLKLELERCKANTEDLVKLILLGSRLDVPVEYEFTEPQNLISLEIVSAATLREALK